MFPNEITIDFIVNRDKLNVGYIKYLELILGNSFEDNFNTDFNPFLSPNSVSNGKWLDLNTSNAIVSRNIQRTSARSERPGDQTSRPGLCG